jgi:hypothetical protein
MTRDEQARVFPVGLALGQTAAGSAPRYAVAGAHGIEQLTDDEWRVWLLAGGARSADGRGGREDLAGAAAESAVQGFCRVYYGLLERRLLVETDIGGSWAQNVTLLPLLAGLGELDREGKQFGLGVIGEAPFVRLDAAAYDAWQWLPFGPSLAAAAERLGLATGGHGWMTVIDRVATLIAGGAAYLHATKESQ